MSILLFAALASAQPFIFPLAVNPTEPPPGKTALTLALPYPFFGGVLYNTKHGILLHGGWFTLGSFGDSRWFGVGFYSSLRDSKIVLMAGATSGQGRLQFLFFEGYLFEWNLAGVWRRGNHTLGLEATFFTEVAEPPFGFPLPALRWRSTAYCLFYEFPLDPLVRVQADISFFGKKTLVGTKLVMLAGKAKVDWGFLTGYDTENRKFHLVPLINVWVF